MPPPALPRGVVTTISGVEPGAVEPEGGVLEGGVSAGAAPVGVAAFPVDGFGVAAKGAWLRMSRKRAAAGPPQGRGGEGPEVGEGFGLIVEC